MKLLPRCGDLLQDQLIICTLVSARSTPRIFSTAPSPHATTKDSTPKHLLTRTARPLSQIPKRVNTTSHGVSAPKCHSIQTGSSLKLRDKKTMRRPFCSEIFHFHIHIKYPF